MPINQRAKEAGIFSSSEVALLARVFDRLKTEHQSADRREALAARVIALFQSEIRNEEELFSKSQMPQGH
jgi:hypothetical protein